MPVACTAQTLDRNEHDHVSDHDDLKVSVFHRGTANARTLAAPTNVFRVDNPRPYKSMSQHDAQQLTHTTVNVPGRGDVDIPLFQRSEHTLGSAGSAEGALTSLPASSKDSAAASHGGAIAVFRYKSPPRHRNADGLVASLDLSVESSGGVTRMLADAKAQGQASTASKATAQREPPVKVVFF